jgi:chemotaxis signal transduction protein
MSTSRREQRKQTARRGEAMILFAVAGNTFAIAATAVDEIRNLDGLRPRAYSQAMRVAKVRHLLHRDSKTYYVVDANTHLNMLPSKPTRLLVLRDCNIAVLVDRIDRMAEINAIYALPRAFAGDERRWYRGLALMNAEGRLDNTDVVPVVNPQAFLTAAEVQVLEASLKVAKSAVGGAVSA